MLPSSNSGHRCLRLTPLRGLTACGLLLLAATAGCQSLLHKSPVPGITSKSRLYTSVVDRVAPMVQPDIEKYQGAQQTQVLATHAVGRDVQARYKRRIALQSLTDPWGGYSTLEHQGLLMAELADGGADNLPALLDVTSPPTPRQNRH